jgi:hypothetical protein
VKLPAKSPPMRFWGIFLVSFVSGNEIRNQRKILSHKVSAYWQIFLALIKMSSYFRETNFKIRGRPEIS